MDLVLSRLARSVRAAIGSCSWWRTGWVAALLLPLMLRAQPGLVDPAFVDSLAGIPEIGTVERIVAGMNGSVYALALRQDGDIIAGGSFTTVSGAPRPYLARIRGGDLPAGPPTFLSQPTNLTLRAGQHGLLSVNVSSADQPAFQWLLDDVPVSGATHHALRLVNASTAQAGNYTLAVSNAFGAVTSEVAVVTVAPPSIHPGAVDTTFFAPTAPSNTVFAIASLEDGSVYVAGQTRVIDGSYHPELVRLTETGAPDPRPVPSPDGPVRSLRALPGSRLLVGGAFHNLDSLTRMGVALLAEDGSLDATFAPTNQYSHPQGVLALAVDSSGRVLAGGEFTYLGPSIAHLIRFLPTGAVDPDFTNNLSYPGGEVLGLAIQPDDGVAVVGSFLANAAEARRNVIRLLEDRSVDTTFGYAQAIDPYWGPNNEVQVVVGQGNGALLVGGSFNQFSYVRQVGLVRLFPDGSLDPSFVCVPSAGVSAVAVEPGGRVIIGGTFRTVNGVDRPGLARLNADGSLDTTFEVGPGSAPVGSTLNVSALAIDTAGRTLAGGLFNLIDGVPRQNLARFLGDTPDLPILLTQPAGATVDIGGSLALNATVRWTPGTSMQWWHDGSAVAGATNGVLIITQAQPSDAGDYLLIASNVFGCATSLVATVIVTDLPPAPGTANVSFAQTSSLNNIVEALAFHDGNLLVGGRFTEVNGSNWNRLVRLNLDGSIDAAFGSPLGAQGFFSTPAVEQIRVHPDGAVLLGGIWGTLFGHESLHFARLRSDGAFDSSFAIGSGPDGLSSPMIAAISFDPWQRTLVIGSFDGWNGADTPTGLVRLFQDGSVDGSLDPHITTRTSHGLETDAHGRVLITASAPLTGNQPAVLRLLPDGRLDRSFTPALCGFVRRLLLLPDGRILLGGDFQSVNGISARGLARLEADGSFDPTFGASIGFPSFVNAMDVQPDGKILIGGVFPRVDGELRNNFARLNPDGSIDPTFEVGPGANGEVHAVAVNEDCTIAIGGTFSRFNRLESPYLALVHGGPFSAPTFVSGPDSLTVTVGEPIVLSVAARALPGPAYQWFFNNQPIAGATNHVLRLETAALSDAGFYSVTVSNALGSASSPTADVQVLPAPAHAGATDATFTPGLGTDGPIDAITLDAMGRILIGGSFTHVDGLPRRSVARLLADGRLDPSFDAGPGIVGGMRFSPDPARVTALGVLPDGSLLAGGSFTNFGGLTRPFLARLHENGAVDTAFDARLSGVFGGVSTILVQSNGRILIGGSFLTVDSTPRSHLARLESDGSLDQTFLPGEGPNGQVVVLARDADDRLYVGGWFALFDNEVHRTLVRLNPDGTLDPTFSPANPFIPMNFLDPCFPLPGGTVPNRTPLTLAIAPQPDGKVLVGGFFTSFGSPARQHLVRLLSDGSVDASFDTGSGPNYNVSGLALLPSGRILIAGCFSSVNEMPRANLARLLPGGSLDLDFDPPLDFTALAGVRAILPMDDNRALIAGAFSSVNGLPAGNIARLDVGPFLLRPALAGEELSMELATIAGRDYVLEFTPSLSPAAWMEVQRVTGDGEVKVLQAPLAETQGYYRLRVE